MRMLNRNTQPFKYALYTGNPTPILDADGNRTGEYSTGYSGPAQARAYIAPATGESSIDGFGTNIDYDRIMTLSDDLGITEQSRLWVDNLTATDHDYTVKHIARSLNHVRIAISKVTRNGGS